MMPKPLSPGAALAAMRKTFGGGRPPKRTTCARCGAVCKSARLSRAHKCAKEKL